MLETVLWTNPSPTSSFSSQTVTLSDNKSNYKYIAVEYAVKTTSTGSGTVLMSVEDFVNAGTSVNVSPLPALCLYSAPDSDGKRYARVVYNHSEDNKINIYDCQRINSQATANSMAIPWKIYGLK